MVPILVVATQLAAAVVGRQWAEEGVGEAAEIMFDRESSEYLRSLLKSQPGAAFTGISSIIGFFVLLFAASKVVVELREVLTTVFGKRHREGKKGFVIGLIVGRLVPITLVVGLGMILAFSALATAALQILTTHLNGWLPVNLALWSSIQRVAPLVLVTLLFALILRWLPPRPPAFKDSLVGGVISCGLLAMLRRGIEFYFGQSSIGTAYGAAVTLVVVLLWIYFTIQIFFIGAEITAYLSRLRHEQEYEDPDPLAAGNGLTSDLKKN
ncbi:YihY/virulence factor BrkB family protein [Luteolibacter pohnpeiensis]|nr:YihY/virulence factor BrkB family protein [Luteolibacter pohnpeiensis]